MLIKDAKKLYLGATQATAVYAGSTKVWPIFSPATLSGLVVWHDAADYTPGSWPNKAGAHPSIVGTPAPSVSPTQQNGRSVVRFKANEGRLRGTSSAHEDFTVVYLTRLWGANYGRSFSTAYPGINTCNIVAGFHGTGFDWCYDNGNVTTATSWPGPGPLPWKLYSMDSRLTPTRMTRFFINGVKAGVDWPDGHGLGNKYHLSGYDATGNQETMDCEVAEVCLWNRRLTDSERVQVEGYLRAKWGLT